ncbi:MAG: hypothetical protein AAFY22_00240 [Pseudomonadota bacterium]
MRYLAPLILYTVLGAGSCAFGLFYALRTEVMPFHLAIIGTPWSEVPDGTQAILMVLMKEMGVGQMVLGLAVLIITYGPHRNADPWGRWAAPLVGAVGMGLTTVFAAEVTLNTGLPSPWPASAVAAVLYGAGYLMSNGRKKGEHAV